jgi:hypothetical protein
MDISYVKLDNYIQDLNEKFRVKYLILKKCMKILFWFRVTAGMIRSSNIGLKSENVTPSSLPSVMVNVPRKLARAKLNMLNVVQNVIKKRHACANI